MYTIAGTAPAQLSLTASKGPGNEASQPVIGISPTTISPAHNAFNHWHDERI